MDDTGIVYVTDHRNDSILVFDADGNFIKTIGSTGSGLGKVDAPFGITVDSAGNIYVTEVGNNRVQIFDTHGVSKRVIGGYGSEKGLFDHPQAIAIASNGSIYVADSSNNRVQIFDEDGNYIRLLYIKVCDICTDVAVKAITRSDTNISPSINALGGLPAHTASTLNELPLSEKDSGKPKFYDGMFPSPIQLASQYRSPISNSVPKP